MAIANPTDFICAVMRQNTDALGFIPRPTVHHQFVARGHYVIQLNRLRKPIGYLIHGPVHPDGRMHIHQACIELDRRNRGFGAQAVRTLIDRAIRGHATKIVLRCAADLDAIHFWTSSGFLPNAISTGGRRRQRNIVHFSLNLGGTRTPSAAPADIVSASTARPNGRLSFDVRGIGVGDGRRLTSANRIRFR